MKVFGQNIPGQEKAEVKAVRREKSCCVRETAADLVETGGKRDESELGTHHVGFCSPGKKFGFYSECISKQLHVFEQRKDVVDLCF